MASTRTSSGLLTPRTTRLSAPPRRTGSDDANGDAGDGRGVAAGAPLAAGVVAGFGGSIVTGPASPKSTTYPAGHSCHAGSGTSWPKSAGSYAPRVRPWLVGGDVASAVATGNGTGSGPPDPHGLAIARKTKRPTIATDARSHRSGFLPGGTMRRRSLMALACQSSPRYAFRTAGSWRSLSAASLRTISPVWRM